VWGSLCLTVQKTKIQNKADQTMRIDFCLVKGSCLLPMFLSLPKKNEYSWQIDLSPYKNKNVDNDANLILLSHASMFFEKLKSNTKTVILIPCEKLFKTFSAKNFLTNSIDFAIILIVMPCFSEIDRYFPTFFTWSPPRTSKQGTDNRNGSLSKNTIQNT
jgi:hypothetical protein